MCYDYSTVNAATLIRDCKLNRLPLPQEDKVGLFVQRTVRLIQMIQKASGGYKRLKIVGYKENGDEAKQLYCTPLNVVRGGFVYTSIQHVFLALTKG